VCGPSSLTRRSKAATTSRSPDGSRLDNIGVITWGRRQGMTRGFYAKYCDEAWGIVPLDGLNAHGKNVRGFDTTALTEALGSI
jgi:hypothetical protein